MKPNLALAKTTNLDLSFVTQFAGETSTRSSQRISREAHSNGPQLDDELCADAEILEVVENGGEVEKDVEIRNTDRAALGRLAGFVASKWGDWGFGGKIKLNLLGSAGQSFGAWLVDGMEVKLEGGWVLGRWELRLLVLLLWVVFGSAVALLFPPAAD